MQGIIDCTGNQINIGDWLKAPNGHVFQVEGGMVLKSTMYNAATCEKVEKPKEHVPHRAHGAMSDGLAAASANDTDCVIWGS